MLNPYLYDTSNVQDMPFRGPPQTQAERREEKRQEAERLGQIAGGHAYQ